MGNLGVYGDADMEARLKDALECVLSAQNALYRAKFDQEVGAEVKRHDLMQALEELERAIQILCGEK